MATKTATTPKAEEIDLKSLLSFDVVKGLTIPTQVKPERVQHPFVKKFDAMEHNDALFIPLAYYSMPIDQGGRGIEADKVDHAYAKDKIRTSFKQWKDKDAARENRKLVLVNRKAGDDAGEGKKFPVDGVSVFMQIVDGAPPA